MLTFYGVGGVGKTRLSRELETRYLAAPGDRVERLSHRVDFEAGSATDIANEFVRRYADTRLWSWSCVGRPWPSS